MTNPPGHVLYFRIAVHINPTRRLAKLVVATRVYITYTRACQSSVDSIFIYRPEIFFFLPSFIQAMCVVPIQVESEKGQSSCLAERAAQFLYSRVMELHCVCKSISLSPPWSSHTLHTLTHTHTHTHRAPEITFLILEGKKQNLRTSIMELQTHSMLQSRMLCQRYPA